MPKSIISSKKVILSSFIVSVDLPTKNAYWTSTDFKLRTLHYYLHQRNSYKP